MWWAFVEFSKVHRNTIKNLKKFFLKENSFTEKFGNNTDSFKSCLFMDFLKFEDHVIFYI